MNESRQTVESKKSDEVPTREPLFGRYQIKIKAGIRSGAVPTGRPPFF